MLDYTYEILKVLHDHADFVDSDIVIEALLEKYSSQTKKNVADKIIELQKSGCIKPFSGIATISDFITKYYDYTRPISRIINIETSEKGKEHYKKILAERNLPTPNSSI